MINTQWYHHQVKPWIIVSNKIRQAAVKRPLDTVGPIGVRFEALKNGYGNGLFLNAIKLRFDHFDRFLKTVDLDASEVSVMFLSDCLLLLKQHLSIQNDRSYLWVNPKHDTMFLTIYVNSLANLDNRDIRDTLFSVMNEVFKAKLSD